MPNQKNILLFTLEYPPFKGGVSNYYYNLVKFWPEPENIFVLNNNDNRLINKKLFFLNWLPAMLVLKKTIKEKNIKHVIIGNILPLGTAVYFLSKILKIKYSVVIHGTDIAYAQKVSRKKIIAGKILEKAENIICNSTYGASLVNFYYHKKFKNKINIINPGVDSHITHNVQRVTQLSEKFILDGKITLFTVSRLIKRKGIDKMIKALPAILKEEPRLVYVVAGIGPDENGLKKMVEDLELKHFGIAEKIIFLGEISEEDKWAWLSLSDIFILPTREEGGNLEGFGIVYLEANLAGKPVIAGDHGGVRDAVVDGETGLLVNPLDIQAITEATLKLAQDEDLRKKLGEQGRERVINKFDWKKQADNFFKILN